MQQGEGEAVLDEQSEAQLAGVHPDLVAVVRKAREITPFRVTEGKRTLERQKKLIAKGASRTMNSRHLTGHAVDLVDMAGTYKTPEMKKIAEAMKQAAGELGVAMTWGGDWVKFVDTPHFELNWHEYPKGTFVSKLKTSAGALSAGGLLVTASDYIPPIPQPLTDGVANIQAYQSFGSQVAGLGRAGVKMLLLLPPTAIGALVILAISGVWFGGPLLKKIRGT